MDMKLVTGKFKELLQYCWFKMLVAVIVAFVAVAVVVGAVLL
mgnify:CR=1 FL=1